MQISAWNEHIIPSHLYCSRDIVLSADIHRRMSETQDNENMPGSIIIFLCKTFGSWSKTAASSSHWRLLANSPLSELTAPIYSQPSLNSSRPCTRGIAPTGWLLPGMRSPRRGHRHKGSRYRRCARSRLALFPVCVLAGRNALPMLTSHLCQVLQQVQVLAEIQQCRVSSAVLFLCPSPLKPLPLIMAARD